MLIEKFIIIYVDSAIPRNYDRSQYSSPDAEQSRIHVERVPYRYTFFEVYLHPGYLQKNNVAKGWVYCAARDEGRLVERRLKGTVVNVEAHGRGSICFLERRRAFFRHR